eukprot:gene9596-1798_t
MVDLFDAPKLEPTSSIIILLLSIVWPGWTQIIAGAMSGEMNSVWIGIGMMLSNIILIVTAELVVYLLMIVFMLLGFFTFGIGWLLIPFSLLGIFAPLLTNIWSIVWGIKCYQKSNSRIVMVATDAIPQPQQPQPEYQQQQQNFEQQQ